MVILRFLCICSVPSCTVRGPDFLLKHKNVPYGLLWYDRGESKGRFKPKGAHKAKPSLACLWLAFDVKGVGDVFVNGSSFFFAAFLAMLPRAGTSNEQPSSHVIRCPTCVLKPSSILLTAEAPHDFQNMAKVAAAYIKSLEAPAKALSFVVQAFQGFRCRDSGLLRLCHPVAVLPNMV